MGIQIVIQQSNTSKIISIVLSMVFLFGKGAILETSGDSILLE